MYPCTKKGGGDLRHSPTDLIPDLSTCTMLLVFETAINLWLRWCNPPPPLDKHSTEVVYPPPPVDKHSTEVVYTPPLNKRSTEVVYPPPL